MASANLYFIAIIPPDEICREVTAFKEDLAKRFGSVTALKVRPHITLKSPFKLAGDQHEVLVNWFRRFVPPVSAFNITLHDFGCFPNKKSPVIFIHPEANNELRHLQVTLILRFVEAFPGIGISPVELDYKPHMTVAYRDLSPVMFEKAWEEYKVKPYDRDFTADKFHLLQHNGKAWRIIEEFLLENNR